MMCRVLSPVPILDGSAVLSELLDNSRGHCWGIKQVPPPACALSGTQLGPALHLLLRAPRAARIGRMFNPPSSMTGGLVDR